MDVFDFARIIHRPRERRPARLEEPDARRQGDGQRAQLVECDLSGAKVLDDLVDDALHRGGLQVHEQALGDDEGGPSGRNVPGPALAGQVERPEGVVLWRGRAAKDPVP